MPIDLTAIGASSGPHASTWTSFDCMLYALSVGAASVDPLGAELAYATEHTQGLRQRALPTMCTVVGGVLQQTSPLDRLGDYDRRMSVHGSVEFALHQPLPTDAVVHSTITIDSIYDKKSGALVNLRVDALDEQSRELFTVRNGIFIRGEGGWGGDAGPKWPAPPTPEAAPDAVVRQPTLPNQHLWYRLNGDRNPLHSDPAFARAAGFERPILHGLCTVGFVGRALLSTVCDDDPSVVREFGCRFAAPVLPGDVVETRVWRTDDGAQFEVQTGDRVVLSSGYLRCG